MFDPYPHNLLSCLNTGVEVASRTEQQNATGKATTRHRQEPFLGGVIQIDILELLNSKIYLSPPTL